MRRLFPTRRRLRWGTLGVVIMAGCQQKMAKEPKYLPLSESSFFGDERSARPDVSGTVARGSLETESPEFQGLRSPPEEGAPPPTSFGTVGIDSTPEQLRKAYLDEFPIPDQRANARARAAAVHDLLRRLPWHARRRQGNDRRTRIHHSADVP